MAKYRLIAASTAILMAGCGDPAVGNNAQHPTVVELFQSQGCSSCPPAIANLNAIADRPDVLALTFAVTYWDQLGWKDTFAKPEFTERERQYAHAGTSAFATPQTVINGRATVNGGNRTELIDAIRRADRGDAGPSITVGTGKVAVGKAIASHQATIWLVRYDARPLSVPIRAGENGGRTLVHRNVVRSLSSLGTWHGDAVTVALPANHDPHLHTAVLLQAGPGGPIIAATRA